MALVASMCPFTISRGILGAQVMGCAETPWGAHRALHREFSQAASWAGDCFPLAKRAAAM